jgi:hypothetical protein
MLAESFRYAAPKARAFGYSIEQITALIGALGNAGIQGSMAGTQLSFAMSRVHRVFKALGTSGEGKNLVDALRAVNEAGWGTTKMMEIFGERGGRAALVLKLLVGTVDDTTSTYNRLLAANRAAAGESKKLADTMRFKVLRSVIESIAIDAFTSKSSDLADTIKNLAKSIKESKTELIAGANGLLQMAIAAGTFAASLRKIGVGEDLQELLEGGFIDSKKFMELRRGTLEEAQKLVDDIRKQIAEGRKSWQEELRKDPLRVQLTFEQQKWMEEPPPIPGTVTGKEIQEQLDANRAIMEAKAAAAEAEKEILKGLQEEAKYLLINTDKYATIEELQEKIASRSKEVAKAWEKVKFATIEGAEAQKLFMIQQEGMQDYWAWRQGFAREQMKKEAEAEIATSVWMWDEKRVALEAFRDAERQSIIDYEEWKVQATRDRIDKELKAEADAAKEALDIEKKKQQEIKQTADVIATNMTSALMQVADGSKSLGEAMKDFAIQTLAYFTQMIIKALILKAIMAAMGMGEGGTTEGMPGFDMLPFKTGGAFFPNRRAALASYQHGGVVNKPTLFNIGEMGEAGPEAILPLTKTSKGLGVTTKIESQGGVTPEAEPRAMNVNMYIQAMDSQSFQDYMEQNAGTVTGLIKRAYMEGDEDLIKLSHQV